MNKAEPLRTANSGARFSCTDDIGILGIVCTVADSVTVAHRNIDNLMRWANDDAASYNLTKTDVIQF